MSKTRILIIDIIYLDNWLSITKYEFKLMIFYKFVANVDSFWSFQSTIARSWSEMAAFGQRKIHNRSAYTNVSNNLRRATQEMCLKCLHPSPRNQRIHFLTPMSTCQQFRTLCLRTSSYSTPTVQTNSTQ